MNDDTERAQQIAAWRAVAPGWVRRRAFIWEATHGVSERLVELLDPQPGETILDLAGGLGETGFLASGRIGPDGRLITTDAAPEMVDAARERAAELGVGNAEFHVMDAIAIPLDDASVDGVLFRFGLMLIPDMEQATAEVARVLRPGGRLALAVWAPPDANDWMTAAGRSALALGLIERPEPDAPGPFRLADPERQRALLGDAGLQLETLEEVPVTWRAASLDESWEATRDTSRTVALLLERLGADEIEAVRQATAERLAGYVAVDGSVAVPGVARVALARRT
jgi:SAM-dependent methyltransferase